MVKSQTLTFEESFDFITFVSSCQKDLYWHNIDLVEFGARVEGIPESYSDQTLGITTALTDKGLLLVKVGAYTINIYDVFKVTNLDVNNITPAVSSVNPLEQSANLETTHRISMSYGIVNPMYYTETQVRVDEEAIILYKNNCEVITANDEGIFDISGIQDSDKTFGSIILNYKNYLYLKITESSGEKTLSTDMGDYFLAFVFIQNGTFIHPGILKKYNNTDLYMIDMDYEQECTEAEQVVIEDFTSAINTIHSDSSEGNWQYLALVPLIESTDLKYISNLVLEVA